MARRHSARTVARPSVRAQAQARAARRNVPFCAAMVLLCLTLLSVFMMDGLSASYKTEAKGEDSARVAIMAMDATTSVDIASIHPGQQQKICLQVANFTIEDGEAVICEVAQRYTVSVLNIEENIPLTWEFCDKMGLPISNSGELEAGVKDSDYIYLSVEWPDGEYDSSYAFEIDALEIIVTAEQID